MPEFVTVTDVPSWNGSVACYFVNDDASGMTDDDRKLCDDFEESLARQGLRLVHPIDGTYNVFCSRPAFGLACDTEDWVAERIGDER